jgi:hypothetical protein
LRLRAQKIVALETLEADPVKKAEPVAMKKKRAA